MAAGWGRVRKIPQEVVSKLGPGHQKFQPSKEHRQGLESSFRWVVMVLGHYVKEFLLNLGPIRQEGKMAPTSVY